MTPCGPTAGTKSEEGKKKPENAKVPEENKNQERTNET